MAAAESAPLPSLDRPIGGAAGQRMRPGRARLDADLAGRAGGPRPSGSTQTPLVTVVLAPVVVAAAAGGLWPLWLRQPLLAAVTTLLVTLLAIGGLVLLSEPDQRTPGVALIAAAAALVLSWCNEWGSGPLPFLSIVQGYGWLVLVGYGLLRYSHPRLPTAERRYMQVVAGWTLVWPWAQGLSSRPAWLDYPANAWWPALWPDRAVSDSAVLLVNLTAATAIFFYGALWARRLMRLSGPARRRAQPSAVAAMMCAAGAALAPAGNVLGASSQLMDLIDGIAAVCVLTVPTALMVAVLRRRLTRANLFDVLVQLYGADSTGDAVRAVRRALDDPGLTVGIWSSEAGCYLDDSGQPMMVVDGGPTTTRTGPDGPDRNTLLVRASTGEPLALVRSETLQFADPELLRATTAALALSLDNARLLETAREQLLRVRAATAQTLNAARAERRRIEQDLHDGAQMRFLALAPLIGAAQARTSDPATSAALGEIRNELRTALEELRRLIRTQEAGLSGGLDAAVRDLASGCPLPVRVELPHRRMAPAVETAAYLTVCEALANAVRHSGASSVVIAGRLDDGLLQVSVQDDGRGGCAPNGGRGIPGLIARSAALGGRTTIVSPPGAGTTVRVEIPCE
jgi:signal transduction histidine kinase